MPSSATHTWTRVPGFDEYGRARIGGSRVERFLKVMRSACRCGAWCSVRMAKVPISKVTEPEQTTHRLSWQDGERCGPPASEVGDAA